MACVSDRFADAGDFAAKFRCALRKRRTCLKKSAPLGKKIPVGLRSALCKFPIELASFAGGRVSAARFPAPVLPASRLFNKKAK